jgi:hypothetical protein
VLHIITVIAEKLCALLGPIICKLINKTQTAPQMASAKYRNIAFGVYRTKRGTIG